MPSNKEDYRNGKLRSSVWSKSPEADTPHRTYRGGPPSYRAPKQVPEPGKLLERDRVNRQTR